MEEVLRERWFLQIRTSIPLSFSLFHFFPHHTPLPTSVCVLSSAFAPEILEIKMDVGFFRGVWTSASVVLLIDRCCLVEQVLLHCWNMCWLIAFVNDQCVAAPKAFHWASLNWTVWPVPSYPLVYIMLLGRQGLHGVGSLLPFSIYWCLQSSLKIIHKLMFCPSPTVLTTLRILISGQWSQAVVFWTSGTCLRACHSSEDLSSFPLSVSLHFPSLFLSVSRSFPLQSFDTSYSPLPLLSSYPDFFFAILKGPFIPLLRHLLTFLLLFLFHMHNVEFHTDPISCKCRPIFN